MFFLRISLCLTFIIFAINTCSCQRKKPISFLPWSSQAPIIDGKLDEWSKPLVQPSSQVNIQYKASNDGEFFYLAVRIPDPYLQSLIMQRGAKILLDTLGKRKESFGLGYPLSISEKDLESLSSESKGDRNVFLQLYSESLVEFDLLGFVEEPIRASNITSRDIKVAAAFDELNVLVYEVKMPLNQIFKRNLQYNETLSLGILVNPAKKSLDDSDDSSLFNTRQNSTITQSNPLMGGNNLYNGGSNMGPPNRQPSSPSIWAKVQLAKAE